MEDPRALLVYMMEGLHVFLSVIVKGWHTLHLRPMPHLRADFYLCGARLPAYVCVLNAFYSADFLLFHSLLFVEIVNLRV
jgi:hypothetical protein